jgi:hypothetical protein
MRPAFFVGTPLEDHKETTLTGRGLLPWQQKVADERTGKRRFHGAFSGGFSAGYHNTCGSELGWTPTQFVSSRSARNKTKQEVADFMDDEDLGELDMSSTLRTTSDYFETPKENIGARLLRLCNPLPVEDPEPFKHKTSNTGLGFTAAAQPASAIIDDVEYSFFEPTSEATEVTTSFILGSVVKPTVDFKPLDLPLNYTPRHYLMHHKTAQTATKLTSVPQRTAAMAEPLFSTVLSPADIQRISQIKTFVQSRDLKAHYTEKHELPFADNPSKQERYFRFVCAKEGRVVAGVGPVNLMKASQIRQENEEFRVIYEAKDKTSDQPVQAPTAERTVLPWQPAKVICLCFNVPEPQVEVQPTTKKLEAGEAGIAPILQTSKRTEELLEPAKHLALFKSIFEDEESLPQKRLRGA